MKTANINLWFALRDARSLDVYEYTFLSVVASRGTMFTSVETARADMKMSRSKYYETRKRLLERGLLTAKERPNQTTIHEVNEAAVAALTRGQPTGRSRQSDGHPSAAPDEDAPSLQQQKAAGAHTPKTASTRTGKSAAQQQKKTRKITVKRSQKITEEDHREEDLKDKDPESHLRVTTDERRLAQIRGLVVSGITTHAITVHSSDLNEQRLYSFRHLRQLPIKEFLIRLLEETSLVMELQSEIEIRSRETSGGTLT